KPKRKDTQVPQPSDPIENVPDEAVHKELGDRLVRAATTASSLEAEQDSDNINKTQSKGRIDAIDADEEITLVNVQDEVVTNDADKEMFDVDVLDGEEVAAGDIVSTASAATTVSAATTSTTTITTVDDITLAQALEEIKSTNPKEKGIDIQVLEPMKPMKRKDQIRFEEETALKLQVHLMKKKEFQERKLKRVDGSKEKRAGTELIQEITKKQKVEDDKKTTDLKQFMEIIPDEKEVAIDAIPLSVKSLKIVN
nr:hypothetical protein [Tanacetum cinerariifolium]